MDAETTFSVKRHNGAEEQLTEEALRAAVRGGALLFEKMGMEGDVKQIWDPSKSDEVAAARNTFEDLKRKGYRAYRTNDKGDQGDAMKEFDPSAGRVILIPPMAGG